MRNSLGILAMMSVMSARHPEIVRETIKNFGHTPLTEDEKMEKRGHKKFYYGEQSVWALNKKNADKRAKKLGYI